MEDDIPDFRATSSFDVEALFYHRCQDATPERAQSYKDASYSAKKVI
jgi:hypothetical protein